MGEGTPVCCAIVALAGMLACAAVDAQASKPTLEEYRDVTGKVAIKLPADWKVHAITKRNGSRILTLYVKIPGVSDPDIRMWLLEETGIAYPLVQAHLDLPHYQELRRSKACTVVPRPVPHLVMDRDNDPLYVGYLQLIVYRRFLCRGIHIGLHCRATTLERIRKQFFDAVRSVTCSLRRWPELPEGYQQTILDGISYQVKGPLADKTLERIHRCVRAVQKEFVRVHGRPARPADAPLQVIVHQKPEQHVELDKRAANAWYGMFGDGPAKRVLAVPYGMPQSAPEGALAWAVTKVLFMERYGTVEPWWAAVGEANLACMWTLTGRKAPWVTKAWATDDMVISHTLSKLEELRVTRIKAYCRHAEAYGLLFRAGPNKYRRAYRSFLQDLAETGDYQAAQQAHLFCLDGAQLLTDVREFLAKRLKVVERK
jgi:hypothetical protein